MLHLHSSLHSPTECTISVFLETKSKGKIFKNMECNWITMHYTNKACGDKFAWCLVLQTITPVAIESVVQFIRNCLLESVLNKKMVKSHKSSERQTFPSHLLTVLAQIQNQKMHLSCLTAKHLMMAL
ncbi:hypothetical protein CRENBAI_013689 [Crenichthys baileyi]|uniref:Uncharacterized protein n=1 Tax=Crenichthys baileyi TaxID=28760 RepID=A0AAV9RAJ9_9TELE